MAPGPSALASFPRGLPSVPRLGIATRGNTTLDPGDVHFAFEHGVRYFNWCGKPDGLSRAAREFGPRRREIVFATQIKARSADAANRELDWILEETGGSRLDIGTLYYVESPRSGGRSRVRAEHGKPLSLGAAQETSACWA